MPRPIYNPHGTESLTKHCILLLLVCACTLVRAQLPNSIVSRLVLEGKYHYGIIIPHHGNMVHLTDQHISFFEVNAGLRGTGENKLDQLYRYPDKGISLMVSDLGGSPYLGKMVCLFPWLNYPMAQSKRLAFNFRFGLGLAYISKPFDRIENYKNIAIGSHINAMAQVLFELKWKATSRLSLAAGLSLTHLSNGAFKIPNLGLNIPTLSAGVTYKINKKEPELFTQELPPLSRKWEMDVIVWGGVSELWGAGGDKYPAYGIMTTFNKPISLKRKLSAGFDIYYDNALREVLRRDGITAKLPFESMRAGITFGHILTFSRLSFIIQVGAYVYQKEKSDGWVYDRMMLQYHINRHIFVNVALKTHLAKADLIEWGLGYRIEKRH